MATLVEFHINGTLFSVGGEQPPGQTLATFLRGTARLTGTKIVCGEGGCGACVVAVRRPAHKETLAVNSCLVPLLACHGWQVTTIEGLGDLHPLQTSLAGRGGSQCGFCSPGMIMNMYSLMKDKTPTMSEVENSFGGNLCRCTGYRPILDAFKALASDATAAMRKSCLDIEDTYKCTRSGPVCPATCERPCSAQLYVPRTEGAWHRVTTLDQLFEVMGSKDVTWHLAAGNTATGVFPADPAPHVVDVSGVSELATCHLQDGHVVLGGGATLAAARDFLLSLAEDTGGLEHVRTVADMLGRVANPAVRNVGTLAGNLVLKSRHPTFNSDVFVVLEAAGAVLAIMDGKDQVQCAPLSDLMTLDLHKKVLVAVELPRLPPDTVFAAFKVGARAENCYGLLTAAFRVTLKDVQGHGKVVDVASLVFGGLDLVHAVATERFLLGKDLLHEETLQGALDQLADELRASSAFLRSLAQALFFKFVLAVDPERLPAKLRSGGSMTSRALSSGYQDVGRPDEATWPLHQPVPKLEALVQCSGKAQFTDDLPSPAEELHAAPVLTTVARATLVKVDPAAALATDGVVAFLSHKDIPGTNTFTPRGFAFIVQDDEIFCSGSVLHAGQMVGLVVARTRDLALRAARLVRLDYSDVQPPVLEVAEAMKDPHRVKRTPPNIELNTQKGASVFGEFWLGRQHHMALEPQTCLVVPTEDGVDVFSATQWVDQVQAVVAATLALPAATVRVHVRRLGGGFGGKITRPAQFTAACALAARHVGRPVRLVLNLTDDLAAVGKRARVGTSYQAYVDPQGRILSLDATMYHDSGCSFNDSPLYKNIKFFPNCYDLEQMRVQAVEVLTDTTSSTWCRGPGCCEGIAFMEHVMEHVAAHLELEPLQVRLANMAAGGPLREMVAELTRRADYDERAERVMDFNQAHRWHKRGLALVPMRFPFVLWGNYSATVSVFHTDGSVVVTHGGVEMGQGINTKVAQACAHVLGVPLSQVHVTPSASHATPNNAVSGGSIGSESCALAVSLASHEILSRLAPVRARLPDATWCQLVQAAHAQNVELSATHMFSPQQDPRHYDIWGVAAAEVQVDLLAGTTQVLRVDIMEDVGQSLSPMVDVGQIEGAFVMGMGYWLSEELVHDPESGRLLNTGTWDYKVPGALDIPADFRVYFRENSTNPAGVFDSKATGEPALCMSVVVMFALRKALAAGRRDAELTSDWFPIKCPASPENVFAMSGVRADQFHLA